MSGNETSFCITIFGTYKVFSGRMNRDCEGGSSAFPKPKLTRKNTSWQVDA